MAKCKKYTLKIDEEPPLADVVATNYTDLHEGNAYVFN